MLLKLYLHSGYLFKNSCLESVNCDIFGHFTANSINTSTQLIRLYFHGAMATALASLHCIYQSIDIDPDRKIWYRLETRKIKNFDCNQCKLMN